MSRPPRRDNPDAIPRSAYAAMALLASTVVILGWLRAFGLF